MSLKFHTKQVLDMGCIKSSKIAEVYQEIKLLKFPYLSNYPVIFASIGSQINS